ncbi:MAG: hypothetical protein ACOY94_15815 [Bacillota bacterium]
MINPQRPGVFRGYANLSSRQPVPKTGTFPFRMSVKATPYPVPVQLQAPRRGG